MLILYKIPGAKLNIPYYTKEESLNKMQHFMVILFLYVFFFVYYLTFQHFFARFLPHNVNCRALHFLAVHFETKWTTTTP